MALVVKQKQYEQMSEGLHNVQISRIEDLGKVETMNGVKDMARIYFKALDQQGKDGSDVESSMRINCVLGAKSRLRAKILNPLGIAAGNEFDLNDLVGVKCQAVIQHVVSENDGKTYGNIVSLLKLKKPSQEV
jgi:hypothetical protein